MTPRAIARPVSVACALLALSALAACGSGDGMPVPATGDSTTLVTVTVPPLPGSPGTPDELPPPPELDDEQIARGAGLYATHCAECHGLDLRGDPNWQRINDDGTYPPPPHDDTGHTWHHSDALLLSLIRDGSTAPNSVMEPFGDVLTDDEIVAILDFIKSTWPEDVRRFQWEQTVRDGPVG